MTKPTHLELELYDTTVHIATDQSSWRKLRALNPELEDYVWSRDTADIEHLPDPAKLAHLARLSAAGTCVWTLHVPDELALSRQNLWILIDVGQHHYPLDLVATCAHEATHGALAILEHIGHRPPEDAAGNDEPTAYLIGWLTGQLMAACAPTWRKLGREKLSLTGAYAGVKKLPFSRGSDG